MSLLKKQKTKSAQRREQRYRASRRNRKRSAERSESNSAVTVVAESDTGEKRIRDRRNRKASEQAKKRPQTEVEKGLASDSDSVKRSTLGIVKEAVEQRWPVSEDVKTKVVQKLVEIIDDDREKTSNQLAACRIAVMADGVNAGREKSTSKTPSVAVNIGIVNAPQEERVKRIDAIAETLGLPPAE